MTPEKGNYLKCENCNRVIVIFSESHPPILMDFPPPYVPNKILSMNPDDVTIIDDNLTNDEIREMIEGFLGKHNKECVK